uniref:Cadherin-4-like n=1 Tax=Petromyzon marinus TaxID=7757 RepID=A0AAJ7UHJ0_PETMA|nr:cadherin-4-like [Petromyzon marinus]
MSSSISECGTEERTPWVRLMERRVMMLLLLAVAAVALITEQQSQVSVPENDRGPFPKLLVQVKSDTAGVDIRYALLGDGADQHPVGLFVMDTVTGRVSVTRSLDREVIAQYRPVDLVVDVIDVNDNRPTFAKKVFHSSVVEGSPRGTFVMRVVASDMDDPLTLNGAIRYHIVLQVPMVTAHRVFTIDRFTGIITNTVRLDRERVAHFSLVVMASDMEGDANIGLSTTATAIVTITDINDHAPEFTTTVANSASKGVREPLATAKMVNKKRKSPYRSDFESSEGMDLTADEQLRESASGAMPPKRTGKARAAGKVRVSDVFLMWMSRFR